MKQKMKRLFGKIALSALLAVPLIFAASSASANYYRAGYGGCNNGDCFRENANALIERVQWADAGWDWEPRCAGGAHWSWNEMRCKGGTGNCHGHHHGC